MAKNTAAAAAAPKNDTNVINPNAAEAPKTEAPAKVVPIEPQSEKLTELRAKRLDFKKLARTFEPDSAEEESALLEAYKIDQLIKAEIVAINAAEAKQKLEIARNERIALFDNAIQAHTDKMTNQENAELAAAYDAAREIVVNELLAKFSGSKPAAAKTSGDAKKSGDGATKNDIVDAHIANVAAGMTDSESRKSLEAAGHKRSTVWFAVDGYNKSK